MAAFVKSVMIDAPVQAVFGFHERTDALALLTPAFPPVRKAGGGSGIQRGTQVELRIAGVRWVAVHTVYEKDRLFVDEQVQGPFRKWIHRHEFEAAGGKTRLTDRVEYEVPGGATGALLFGWAIRAGLHRMFALRHRVTREFCERRQ